MNAQHNIEDIYAYIALEKKEPDIAKGLTDRIWDAIESLELLPYSHQERLVGRYAGKVYRQLLIDNYIAVYKISKEEKRIYIVTVQYGGQNM